MKNHYPLFIIALVSLFSIATLQAQKQNAIPVKNGTEHAISDWFTFNDKETREQNKVEMKMALQSAFSFPKGFSLVVEVSDLHSYIYLSPAIALNLGIPTTNFGIEYKDIHDLGGYSVGLKVAKTIKTGLLDTKSTIDVISGLIYKNQNLHQFSDNQMPFINPAIFEAPRIDFIDIIPHQAPTQIRDAHIQSIAIPLDFRTNVFWGNFIFSPTFGLTFDLPIVSEELYYEQIFTDEGLRKGAPLTQAPITTNKSYSLLINSKMELAYQLPSAHRIKLAAFYNVYVGPFSYLLSNEISNKGIQVGYEIPFDGR